MIYTKASKTLAVLLLINIAVAGLGFTTRVMLANTLPKEAFGDLAFALALGSYGIIFVQFGMDKSLVKNLVQRPTDFAELVASSLLLRLILFGAFLLFMLALVPVWSDSSSPSSVLIVVTASAISGFGLAAAYDVWQSTRRHSMFYLGERLVYFSIIWLVFVVPWFAVSLKAVALGIAVSVIVGIGAQYGWAIPRLEFGERRWSWSSVSFLARSSVWVWMAALFGLSIEVLTPILLRQISGSEVLAEFSVGWTFVMLGILAINQIGRVARVSLAKYVQPDAPWRPQVVFVARYLLLMIGIGASITIVILIAAGWIIEELFPASFSNATAPLKLLAFHPLFYAPYLVAVQYLISAGLQKIYFWLIGVTSIGSVGLSLWLIPEYQAEGAAISLVASLAFGLVLFFAAAGYHLLFRAKTKLHS